MEENVVKCGHTVILPKMGRPDEKVIGTLTNMAASRGEDWQVPCDRRDRGQDFDDWFSSVEMVAPVTPEMLERLLLKAWDASRQRHTAGLRRIGWMDQKGRVWTQMPSGREFDGGSLTPLLIDVRD
jgi:hypothetical protein